MGKSVDSKRSAVAEGSKGDVTLPSAGRKNRGSASASLFGVARRVSAGSRVGSRRPSIDQASVTSSFAKVVSTRSSINKTAAALTTKEKVEDKHKLLAVATPVTNDSGLHTNKQMRWTAHITVPPPEGVVGPTGRVHAPAVVAGGQGSAAAALERFVYPSLEQEGAMELHELTARQRAIRAEEMARRASAVPHGRRARLDSSSRNNSAAAAAAGTLGSTSPVFAGGGGGVALAGTAVAGGERSRPLSAPPAAAGTRAHAPATLHWQADGGDEPPPSPREQARRDALARRAAMNSQLMCGEKYLQKQLIAKTRRHGAWREQRGSRRPLGAAQASENRAGSTPVEALPSTAQRWLGNDKARQPRGISKQRSEMQRILKFNNTVYHTTQKEREKSEKDAKMNDAMKVYEELSRGSDIIQSQLLPSNHTTARNSDDDHFENDNNMPPRLSVTSASNRFSQVTGVISMPSEIPRGLFNKISVRDDENISHTSEGSEGSASKSGKYVGVDDLPGGVAAALKQYRSAGKARRRRLRRAAQEDPDRNRIDDALSAELDIAKEVAAEQERRRAHETEAREAERVSGRLRDQRFYRVYHRAAPALVSQQQHGRHGVGPVGGGGGQAPAAASAAVGGLNKQQYRRTCSPDGPAAAARARLAGHSEKLKRQAGLMKALFPADKGDDCTFNQEDAVDDDNGKDQVSSQSSCQLSPGGNGGLRPRAAGPLLQKGPSRLGARTAPVAGGTARKGSSAGWAPFSQSVVATRNTTGPLTSKAGEVYARLAAAGSGRAAGAQTLTRAFNTAPEDFEFMDLASFKGRGKDAAAAPPPAAATASAAKEGNDNNDDELAAAVRALSGQRKLRHLRLGGGNDLGRAAAATFQIFCEVLSSSELHRTLVKLDLSEANLQDKSGALLFEAMQFSASIKFVDLQKNKLGLRTARALNSGLANLKGLEVLDLSWNRLEGAAGAELALALEHDGRLQHLNLGFNALGDARGGPALAAALAGNRGLRSLGLAHAGLGVRTAAVAAGALRRNRRLEELDLSGCAFGHQGGRALFRTLLFAEPACACRVVMTDGTFGAHGGGLFDRSHPPEVLDERLDLADHHDVAVLQELLELARRNPRSEFEAAEYWPNKARARPGANGEPLAPPQTLHLAVVREPGGGGGWRAEVVRRGQEGRPWEPYNAGLLRVRLRYHRALLAAPDVTPDRVLDMAIALVGEAPTSNERLVRLGLVAQDLAVTTEQLGRVVREFKRGHEHLRAIDVVTSFWTRVVDVENLMPFLDGVLESGVDGTRHEQKRRIAQNVSFERFGFTPGNPSGHYRLVLRNRPHRECLQLLLDINHREAQASQASGRGDTSQKGNWANFRNEACDGRPVTLDMEFLTSSAFREARVLEFDYVSTSRPPADAVPLSDSDFENLIGEKLHMHKRLGEILREHRLHFLASFQLYTAGLWVTTKHITRVLDILGASNDPHREGVQARCCLVLFARCVDADRFCDVLRSLPERARREVLGAVGVLNAWNPLRPSVLDYHLHLVHRDERVCLRRVMDLALAEEGNWLRENPGSDLSFVDLYAIMARVENWARPATVRFRYLELGEVLGNRPNWAARERALRHVLLGTPPVPAGALRPAARAREMEAAGWGPPRGDVGAEYLVFLEARADPGGAAARRTTVVEHMVADAAARAAQLAAAAAAAEAGGKDPSPIKDGRGGGAAKKKGGKKRGATATKKKKRR